jgi:hypothetical protein
MVKRIPTSADDVRMLEALAFGRKIDEMIRSAHLDTHNDYGATARRFRLSEAEIRYIVQHPDRRIPAGVRT